MLEFFKTSGRNLLVAEAAAAVGIAWHCLSWAPTAFLKSGCMCAKLAQENLIKASGIPHTILRSMQFFEFIGGIINSGGKGDVIRLSPALVQPIAWTMSPLRWRISRSGRR